MGARARRILDFRTNAAPGPRDDPWRVYTTVAEHARALSACVAQAAA
jgi:hypothetical protein